MRQISFLHVESAIAGRGLRQPTETDSVVIVLGPDGEIDHKKSLKLSGLWSSLSKECQQRLEEPIQAPLRVVLLDSIDAVLRTATDLESGNVDAGALVVLLKWTAEQLRFFVDNPPDES